MQMLIPQGRMSEEPEILARIACGQGVSHFETVRVRKDGKHIHISVSISPVTDCAGRIVGASKIARDISDQRRAEVTLHEKEARLHATDSRLAAIVQGMNEACFAVDRAWCFTFVNDRTETLLGRRREEMLGKSIWALFPRATAPTKKHYHRVMVERVPVSFEAFSPVAGRWLDIRLFPSGEGLAAFVLDIDERKQTEFALRESELSLISAQTRAKIGNWEVDAATHTTKWSAEMFRIFGRDPSRGHPKIAELVLMIHPDDREAFGGNYARVTTELGMCEQEFRVARPDGGIRWVESRGEMILDETGQALRLVGTAQDITERKLAEDEIRGLNANLEQRVIERTAQLETANKELEAFSYSVSHDLRAPLRGIHGYVRMLMEDYADRLDANGNRLLGVVGKAAKRMGQLIDDLLAFSRMSRQKMGSTIIDVTAMAREEFENLTRAVPEAPLRFDLQPLSSACGDPAMLRQVFANLLANAIKFSRDQVTPIVEVGSWGNDDETTFYVKDNGVGFDDQYGHRLFGVFQRLHSEDEFEGTGVGLALVQRIIHRHGGKVWADGKPNQGATFYFTLPTQSRAQFEHLS